MIKTGHKNSAHSYLSAQWPAAKHVHTLISTRQGGVSLPPFDQFNLSQHVGDDPIHVAANRAQLQSQLPSPPVWLKQVHGRTVIEAASALNLPPVEADASYTRHADIVCTVLTADCLPVLFSDRQGSVIAAAHAGWRGLYAGVLEATLTAMQCAPTDILVWLGPAIGPDAFEVGAEVYDAFIAQNHHHASAFHAIGQGQYLANLYQLARIRLQAAGIIQLYGGNFCTVIERERFFSYRRDGQTGRMASLIWLS